ncbi:hypothetical protein [Candidatus Protochlamydia phocaeensis]|uniref:hypothetical protein n=1 Tax=Candidatus Protochlamydia phocaeensis TaxID=1414722 RepID=UPI000838075E|nr:hypothetical protein [Candidatus Protochlamydia phocaeensis]
MDPNNPFIKQLLIIGSNSRLTAHLSLAMVFMSNYFLQGFCPLLPQIGIPTWIAIIEGPCLSDRQAM